MNTSTRLRQLADRMGLDGFAEELREIAGDLEAPAEPFGYFRAEPMGWTDCAATDEGAIALYERPAAPAVPEGEPVGVVYSFPSGDGNTGWGFKPNDSAWEVGKQPKSYERRFNVYLQATPAPSQDHVTDGFPWEAFPVWLVEHHEGETITKECLTYALGKMFFALGKKSGGA